MPTVQLGQIKAYYEEHGSGAPVLLLHNYFGTVETWAAQRDGLVAHYRVVAVDARAHGRSTFPGGRLRLTDFARDVEVLIERIDLAPAHLVGSSLGALTALLVAERRSDLVRSLTLEDPPHLDEPTCHAYMDRLVQEVIPANEAAWAAPHLALGPCHMREVLLANFAADRREQPEDQRRAVTDANIIDRPVLIVAGDRDPVFPLVRALELRDRIAEAELLVLPRGGHLPHRVYPDLFNRVLLDFLARRS